MMLKNVLLSFAIFIVVNPIKSFGNDEGSVKACLAHWDNHPFNVKHPQFRSYNTKVRVFGVGGKISDTRHTPQPDLVLIKPNISVMTKTTMDLMNPNGWYCLRGKVNVMSSTTINLHCKAHLASSTSGVTVLGGNNEQVEKETTILGGARVRRVGCAELAPEKDEGAQSANEGIDVLQESSEKCSIKQILTMEDAGLSAEQIEAACQ